MKKSVRVILGKVLAVILAVCVFAGCLVFMQSQETVSPENPITEGMDIPHVPLAGAAVTTQVDEELLDLESEVENAAYEENDGQDLNFDDYVNNNENSGKGMEAGGGAEPETETTGTSGPGSGSFDLPTDLNYFFVDIVDLQDPYSPDDPRCYYKFTHIYSELKVDKVVFLDNGKPVSHYGGTSAEGWFNLTTAGENWLKARVTYQLPNGETRTFERATNPPMVHLHDPSKVNLDDHNLQAVYDNPKISFYVNPNPVDAHVQVFLDGRIIPQNEDGRYYATLKEGGNTFTIRGKARGWKDNEIEREVFYRKTEIKVYSPELEQRDFRYNDYTHYEKDITFTVKVEHRASGKEVSGTNLDIYLRGVLVKSLRGGNHTVTLPMPTGQNQIAFMARGANENNNETASDFAEYRIQCRPHPDEELPADIKVNPGTSLPFEGITNDPIFVFKITPTVVNESTGQQYIITEHKQHVSHTYTVGGRTATTPVICNKNIMEVYCYRIYLREGLNIINLRLVTDDIHEVTYEYKLYYVPADIPDEPIGKIYISVDASVIGLPNLAGGYVDIYPDQPLSYAVLEFLKQYGYQAAYKGQSNYSMYLEAIIKNGMLAGWDDSKISEAERQLIEEAGGADIWHGTYDINSLGERDFTTISGWMFSLNGKAISGLSNEYPKDGDRCRAMFTLTGGSDVGL
ncbi:MAG: hypothetical protein ACOYI4_09080 [Christensenellales bacterium]